MNRAIIWMMLTYYTLGQFVLPMGDFSVLPDLPAMYQHCKAWEHRDMNPIDFITDHLINMDGLFDAHDNGDEQKPHQPFPLHHSSIQLLYINPGLPLLQLENKANASEKAQILPVFEDIWRSSEFLGRIFRPPILYCILTL